MRQSSGLFLLKLKEQRRISQVAIDDIVDGCRSLFSQTVARVQAGVNAKLAEFGVDPDSVTGLDSAFKDVSNPFQGLETCYLQEKYFRDTLGLIVSLPYAYMLMSIQCTLFSFTNYRNQKKSALENQSTGHNSLEQSVVSQRNGTLISMCL